MTRVSVITVTRNDREGLTATRQSVLAQTHPEIQHVVIDGASSDGTLELLARWRAAAPAGRFTALSEPDAGIADAMNKGVALADGDLLMHLNAGDALVGPEVIARVVDSHARRAWQWGVGNLLYREGGLTYRRRIDAFSPAHLLRGCYLAQPATFFTAALRPLLRFDPSLRIAMDYDVFLRLAFAEGLRPVPLGIDVTAFDRHGVSRAFWPAYWENVRVRRRYAPATWRPAQELAGLGATLVRRGVRGAVLAVGGERAKNRLREAAGDDVFRIERVP